MRRVGLTALSLALGACASAPSHVPYTPPPTARPASPPPQRPQVPTTGHGNAGFIAPDVMQHPGLEGVIGLRADQLERNFGKPRLDIKEGDARKLQFAGKACVLDIYLYPLRPGAQPSATHVEARRASDGQQVDRASCAQALKD